MQGDEAESQAETYAALVARLGEPRVDELLAEGRALPDPGP